MLDEIKQDASERMTKSVSSLRTAFSRIRTGRATPSLLDAIEVEYYGTLTPINQVASISVEDARTLMITPWEKSVIPDIEKAILKSDLGLTPTGTREAIRLPLPPLTEENRRDLIRKAKGEAETARVSIRNVRRDAIADVRELVREKESTEDEGRRAEEQLQKITDSRVNEVDDVLAEKESDLLAF
ncbi:MAG: ribosome recycling factor [Pseudomonadota bacterium]|nr:ribosome recycling factor [Pseudomonadota bacterium]|tara:strand:+ start:133 stop:690 length:558 start_codon:yes stop_codon:yes gene_type:complete